jgi:hypothetical protein
VQGDHEVKVKVKVNIMADFNEASPVPFAPQKMTGYSARILIAIDKDNFNSPYQGTFSIIVLESARRG